MSSEKLREKFDKLRARYLTAKKRRDVYDVELRAKYGSNYSDVWLNRSEERLIAKLREKAYEAGSVFFDFVQSFSPRDWSYGVPAQWIYEDLTFEDAARPADEQLSVVPPLSYGSTVHRT